MFKWLLVLSFTIASSNILGLKPVRVASKTFTEAVILGQIAWYKLNDKGVLLAPHKELGGTSFLYKSLLKGETDIYADYTGTLIKQILRAEDIKNIKELKKALKSKGLGVTHPLGFNNSYALGMIKTKADMLGIDAISDLVNHKKLRINISHEFLARSDGFKALARYYDLPNFNVRGIEHPLAFEGLIHNEIDVTDVYTTEAEINRHNIKILSDDKDFFPAYKPVYVYRLDLAKKCPQCIDELNELSYSISEEDMRLMNKRVIVDKQSESRVALGFLNKKFGIQNKNTSTSFLLDRLSRRTMEHLSLVFTAMFFAITVGIVLGIIAFKVKRLGNVIITFVSIMQTIPSLALLVLMIPLFGVGFLPAVLALFFYGLLPIVRSTYTGFLSIPKDLLESAFILGLNNYERLIKIELPMISRQILSGIKTALVISVGTATLGALIGAGGYGKPIITGIRLLDMHLILEGAIPAAFMAIGFQWLFGYLDKIFVPRGLFLESSQRS